MNRKIARRGAVLGGVALALAVLFSAATPARAELFGGRGCCLFERIRQANRASEPTATVDGFDGAPQYDCLGRTIRYVPKGLRVPLFNGVDLAGWTNVKGDAPNDGWKVVDGAIFREKNAGDLYAAGNFDNFILEFDFKVAEKGNSGVKYRSWNGDGFGLGCEYQIYDDIADAKNPPRYQTASLYDVVAPRQGTAKIKMGEFNRGKIVVAGNRVQHYLNGELIVSIDVGSADWRAKVAQSKFKDVKEFGTTTPGRLLLQDHNCQVWFKNIVVTKLTPVVCADARLFDRFCAGGLAGRRAAAR